MTCYCAEMSRGKLCAHCRCLACGKRRPVTVLVGSGITEMDVRALFTCLRCLNDLRRKEAKPVILV